uniref:Uncharacterized protein n=1 Tax=Heterorhabditis bacteriophora TaxID=37862 RepID=A0A1I7WLC9_HETBA
MNDIITGTTVPRTRNTTKGLMGIPLPYSAFPKNGYSPYRWKPKIRRSRASTAQGEWNSFPHLIHPQFRGIIRPLF